MAFQGIVDSVMESEQEEVERLGQASEGSLSRHLSTLPVNIKIDVMGRVIELPNEDHLVVVVPFRRSGSSGRLPDDRVMRNGGWWEVVVVHSDHPSYPVGGYHLAISEAELVRGRIVKMTLSE